MTGCGKRDIEAKGGEGCCGSFVMSTQQCYRERLFGRLWLPRWRTHEPRSWHVIGVSYQDSLEASREFIRNANVTTTISRSILAKPMIHSNYNMFHRPEKFLDQDAPVLLPLRWWDLCEGLGLSEDKAALADLGLPLLIPTETTSSQDPQCICLISECQH